MMLVEQTEVPTVALPIAEFRDHLKLGTGYPDDAAQDVLLEQILRAAIAAVERRTGKALFLRPFLWTLAAWRGIRREELPVAPVAQITELRIVEADGTPTVVPTSAYALQPDAQRPLLCAVGLALPTVPVAGRIEILFDAGFASGWAALPHDLTQAVLLLAAHFHENRHAVGADQSALPLGVEALLAPFRPFRLFGRLT